MVRGDDVVELQRQLCALGFDTGRVDGIFGPDTERAVKDFQRNAAITNDGVCGRDTLAALRRLGDRTAGDATVAHVRQAEALRQAPRSLLGRRVAIGERGGLDSLTGALHRAVTDAGANALVLHHPDESEQAAVANGFDADVYLCVELSPEDRCLAAYFRVPGFESLGGRRLAELVVELVPPVLDLDTGTAQGMRVPVLRETRMPAVVCHLGPADRVVAGTAALADTLRDALARWAEHPLP